MPSVSRDALKKYLEKCTDATQREIASLRLQYSEIAMLKNTFLESVRYENRIYPTILPTQASGRWSYIKPPLSNFPKRCINPECPKGHHSRTQECWSLRDCLIPDPNTFWIDHDLNAVEHVIYSLILQWEERLNDLRNGIDIHTPITCSLFGLPVPTLPCIDPHKSAADTAWRAHVNWQGKDDTRRTMSKNFTYGGQYFYVSLARRPDYRPRLPYRCIDSLVYNPNYVFSIPNIESYKILGVDGKYTTPEYLSLAIRFVESNVEIQKRKALVMEKCRRDKVSRTLYGGKRHAWFSDQEAAKQLFNHIIQGTVASYINESCILLQRHFPDSYLIHNQHDSLKWAFTYQSTTANGKVLEESQMLAECKSLCERTLAVGKYSIPISATFKVVRDAISEN